MPPPKARATRGHATGKFDVLTGVQAKAASNAPSYTKVFAQALMAEARAMTGSWRHRRDARWHGPEPVRRTLPAPLLSTWALPNSMP
jgi:hypothetical protein